MAGGVQYGWLWYPVMWKLNYILLNILHGAIKVNKVFQKKAPSEEKNSLERKHSRYNNTVERNVTPCINQEKEHHELKNNIQPNISEVHIRMFLK